MGGEVAALHTSGQRPCGSGQSPAESSSWGAAPNRDTRFPEEDGKCDPRFPEEDGKRDTRFPEEDGKCDPRFPEKDVNTIQGSRRWNGNDIATEEIRPH